MTTHYVRFTIWRRLEHAAMILLFTLLVLTGFPQRFYEAGWAHTLVGLFGGVGPARMIHRLAGVLFALLVAVHLGWALWLVLRRRTKVSVLVPTRQDFSDAIQTLRYYLGANKHHPRFDRFDYRQKFEYWGLVLGSLLMVATGFILIYPIAVATWLPGQVIPAAKLAHSNEGLMAFLVVIVWHLYNAILSPDVFPIDTSIFTGKISRERMAHEHPLELERIEAAEPPGEHGA